MKTLIWKTIRGTGHLVCPDCYRRMWDNETQEADVLWFCHHCELDTYDPAYSWCWPLDILWPRLRYVCGAPRRAYVNWREDR